MEQYRKYWMAALTLILFGAFAFRLWNLGTQSLWHDEAWSVISSYQPLHPIDPNYPPFFTVLLGVWNPLAGDSVFALRYFSLLFGVATVAAVALLMRRWFNPTSALLAAIFVAISPPLWVYSQEIRSYVAMPLLTIILLTLANVLLHQQVVIPRRTWIWILLIETIALYTHNLAVPLVAWLNVTVTAVWLLRRDWRRVLRWLAAQIGVLIVYLPWLLTQRPTGTLLNTPPSVAPSLFWDIWQSYFTGIKALVDADSLFMLLMAIFGVIAVLLMIVAVRRHRNQQMLLVVSQVVLLPLFELIIILVAHIDFHPRYFLLGVIPTLMLVAVGLTSVASRRDPIANAGKLATDRRLPRSIVCGGVMLLGLLVTARMVSLLYSNAGYQHDDFRSVAAEYASRSANDAIIIPYGWEPTFDYYQRKMPWKAKTISIPLHTDANTIFARLRDETLGVQRVDFLTWFQLPADVRRAYPCLLGTNRIHMEPTLHSGIKTDSYFASGKNLAMPTPQIFTDSADFGVLQLEEVQSWSGAEGACVVSHWKLKQPTTQNWSIAVRALNPLGWEIAKSDDALLTDNQLPTSFWCMGDDVMAFSFLAMPLGTVQQTKYPIRISVYNKETPQGLDVLQNGGSSGKGATIGTVTRLADFDEDVQPENGDVQLEDSLFLNHQDFPTGQLQPGQPIHITLRWLRTNLQSDAEKVTVSLEGQGWQTSSEGVLYPDPFVLTWHELNIPATANGSATLKVTGPSGKTLTLAQLEIAKSDHVFTEPAIKQRIDMEFTGVGSLVGADNPATIKSGEAFNVNLIWKADTTPTTAYTVFVHLLDSNGQVIAQNDSPPVNNQRPTTSWVTDEYIIDSHTLSFNRPYSGRATLEVGLYDPVTSKRVALSDGTDHSNLPDTIEVR